MAIVTVLVGFLTTVWLAPQVAAWVTFGHSAPLGFWRAQTMFIHLISGDAAPTGAYPPVLAAAISAHARFGVVLALVVACEVSLVVGALLRLDRTTSRPMADRRWWDLRGIRPRAFARPHTIDELLVSAADPMRIVVGRYDQALLAVEANLQTLVVAAPRTGKTSGLVIPAILEHAGPVINTTVRTDVRDRTIARRSKLGRVFVWDPFGKATDGWDLLHGCEDWSHALRCARWLTSAENLGDGGNTAYFKLEAEQLLAPLLHAAALWPMKPFKTMRDVYNWVQTRAEDEPMQILHMAQAEDAIRRFQSVYAYNDRQRDGIIGAAAAVLQAYGNPAVERTLTAKSMLTPAKLFAPGQTNTLYIVADREHQKLLAPLVVTLISTLLHYVAAQENDKRPLQPPCLCALDETANIAPLEDLPEILATSLPSMRFMTVWHSVAQIQRRYTDQGASELLALSQAKVFLGSITDRATVDEVTRLMANRSQDPLSTEERASQSLQRTSDREGLLIHTHKPPVVFRQRRYYLDADLKQLSTSEPVERRLNPLA
ncbi:MAG TPA: type IV secretory system conjugative DNA transfer family protein, partial [Steroidobacteraceae bacterium]|nr:type IV secretory system conjugative DNA transfer family protein [Steroidobacteraceae bacterium]